MIYRQTCLDNSGDMIYLNVLGQHIIILSSLEVITDLFEKRSSNYSGRMHTTMVNELYVSHSFSPQRTCQKMSIDIRMNWGISMAFMPYGLWWRQHRKIFHEFFHRNAVAKYQPIQRQEVQAFLRRLLVTPDNFLHHIRQ